MKKYIVSYGERSDGPQCNNDYIKLVESERIPTVELLRKNRLINDGSCNNIATPGCEECMGSRTVDFKVEPFSSERAEALGLVDILYSSQGLESCRDNYLHRLEN
jgi:hypothetical protein